MSIKLTDTQLMMLSAAAQRSNRCLVAAPNLKGAAVLIPEEAAPQFLDDAAPRNGMMPPPDSEMIAPPITE
jgi:hypothetical protein